MDRWLMRAATDGETGSRAWDTQYSNQARTCVEYARAVFSAILLLKPALNAVGTWFTNQNAGRVWLCLPGTVESDDAVDLLESVVVDERLGVFLAFDVAEDGPDGE